MTKDEAKALIARLRVAAYHRRLTHVEEVDIIDAKAQLTGREVAEALDQGEAEIHERFTKPNEERNARIRAEWNARPWWVAMWDGE